jgi:hypothetical protein
MIDLFLGKGEMINGGHNFSVTTEVGDFVILGPIFYNSSGTCCCSLKFFLSEQWLSLTIDSDSVYCTQ